MQTNWMILLSAALAVHLLLNTLLWCLVRLDVLRVSGHVLILPLLVPFFGLLLLLEAEWATRRGCAGSRQPQVDLLELEDGDIRAAQLAEEDDGKEVIPLEEAILINDAQTRRRLMIGILRQNPEQYVDLLQKARLNDDAEVTHYAATAMMELQREYDLKLQRCDRALSDQPDSLETIDRYRQALSDYIASGLLTGNTLTVQRVRYRDLLTRRLSYEDAGSDIYCAAADNELELGELHTARALIDQAIGRWPQNEAAWMLLLKYHQTTRDGAAVRQTIDRMKENRVYLSPASRERVAFFGK